MTSRPVGGFTLPELMVAMVILVVGVLAMMGFFGRISTLQRVSDDRMELTRLGESKMEELRAASVSGRADTLRLVPGGSLTTSTQNHADTTPGSDGRLYVRRWLVQPGPADARRVTVRVEPLAPLSGAVRGREFATYVLVH